MRLRNLAAVGTLAVAVAVVSVLLPLSAQSPGPATPRFAADPPFTPPEATYAPPKTEWGDPNISGVYDFMTFIRMQRPPEYAGKKVLTEEELKTYRERYELNQDACGVGTRAGEQCTPEENAAVGAYNEFWDTRKWIKDLRTSLIEDPDDGRIPPMTPEAQRRMEAWRESRREFPRVINTWLEFPTVSRCIAEQTPNGPQMYNSGTMIVQSPGWVMLLRERLDTRYIALDGRPHIDDRIRLWDGHSVGRWEGHTLVVDTTNFTDKQINGGVGSTVPGGVPFGNIHLVEHFVPVSPTQINYYATIEDPTTWVRPWTFMLPWQKDPEYVIYEYACVEGNLSIENSLRGSRLQEAREAEVARLRKTTGLTSSLVGKNRAEIRSMFGTPVDEGSTRWGYRTANGNPVYLFFETDRVALVQPDDLPLSEVQRR